MKRDFGFALVLAGLLVAVPWTWAQSQGNGNAGQNNAGQSKGNAPQPANGAGQQKSQPNAQSNGNPFPEDTKDVPVMPSRTTPDVPPAPSNDEQENRVPIPRNDLDPVKSPDGAGDEGSNMEEQESSSSMKNLDSILPTPGEDDTEKRGRRGSSAIEGAPKETSTEDINVGKYYLDNKNWRAALSRFQSALVLAPEEPDVYWGLAESERHLGDYAHARAHYQKVIEYDPDSKHAKEAQKALKDPEIANAKAVSGTQTPQ